jgi:hypothetical protein
MTDHERLLAALAADVPLSTSSLSVADGNNSKSIYVSHFHLKNYIAATRRLLFGGSSSSDNSPSSNDCIAIPRALRHATSNDHDDDDVVEEPVAFDGGFAQPQSPYTAPLNNNNDNNDNAVDDDDDDDDSELSYDDSLLESPLPPTPLRRRPRRSVRRTRRRATALPPSPLRATLAVSIDDDDDVVDATNVEVVDVDAVGRQSKFATDNWQSSSRQSSSSWRELEGIYFYCSTVFTNSLSTFKSQIRMENLFGSILQLVKYHGLNLVVSNLLLSSNVHNGKDKSFYHVLITITNMFWNEKTAKKKKKKMLESNPKSNCKLYNKASLYEYFIFSFLWSISWSSNLGSIDVAFIVVESAIRQSKTTLIRLSCRRFIIRFEILVSKYCT